MKYLIALIAIVCLSDAASAQCSTGPLRQRFQVFASRTRVVERVRTVVARPVLVRPFQGTVLRSVQAGGCANGACAIPATAAKK